VHSPHYLGQLWRLAEEAKKKDLFVPLEFDTEWESDGEEEESDDEDLMQPRAQLVTGLALTADLKSLGSEVSALEALLAPSDGDVLLSQAMFAESRSTKAVVAECGGGGVEVLARGTNVLTPYGAGTVKSEVRGDGILKIGLQWGGTGYFRAESVASTSTKRERIRYNRIQVAAVSEDEGNKTLEVFIALLEKLGVKRTIASVIGVNRSALRNAFLQFYLFQLLTDIIY